MMMELKAKRQEHIPIMDMVAGELHVVEMVAALHAQLYKAGNTLEKRLRSFPDGWRQYRMAMSAADKMLDGLYMTVPDRTLVHMIRLMDKGECIIRPQPASRAADDVQILLTEDVKRLVNVVIANECATCLRDPQEQRRCKLRKTLLNAVPPKEIADSKRCPYIDVAVKSEHQKYI